MIGCNEGYWERNLGGFFLFFYHISIFGVCLDLIKNMKKEWGGGGVFGIRSTLEVSLALRPLFSLHFGKNFLTSVPPVNSCSYPTHTSTFYFISLALFICQHARNHQKL